ncbi:MAG: spore coat protein U domain-containing protein [Gammaproteobacteria bacterium]|jgi:spore coat protein U-like protein|nr:MAG: spore coat protein U domain-containing protein [Gammaproteobacteria bacterium]
MKSRNLKALRAIGATATLTGILVIPAAMAATATGTFQVTAEVQAQCEVDTSTTDMDFGVIDVSADNDATSSLAYRCTAGTQPDAALTYSQMSGTGGNLAYTLYQDAPGGVVWSDTSTQTLPAATGFGTADTVTVYGRVTALNASIAGVGNDYSDTVTVTLTF